MLISDVNQPKFVSKQLIIMGQKTLDKSRRFSKFLIEIGNIFIFLARIIKETFSFKFEFLEFFRQCYQVGYKTLPLISVTGTAMGLVLTIQSRPTLIDFGAATMLPSMVTISIIREMGPVITGLICAGKIGSGFGAELGSMKVTEQIDAMEVSSANPIRYLVVTRVLASTFMIPILTLYADALGILGSWAALNIKGNVTLVLFFSQAFRDATFSDFIPAVVKTFMFGAVIGLVGCYKGYHAGKGTESVGIAATSSVVTASLLVIILDMIAVQITDMLFI